eukprot:1027383-Rhodomonas_salina.2
MASEVLCPAELVPGQGGSKVKCDGVSRRNGKKRSPPSMIVHLDGAMAVKPASCTPICDP